MNANTMTVNFHGTDLFVVEHEGQPYTPMKTIVEAMGLSWQGQHEKLKANESRWGIKIILIPTVGAMQEAVCMPLRKLFGWLSTIHPNKVKPEIRNRIITYQNECDDVLWQHWHNKQGHAPSIPERKTKKALPGCLTLEQQDVIKEMVRVRGESVPKAKQASTVISTWSAIKTKFGCTYKEIPKEEFSNIVSLIARMPIEGEFIQKQESLEFDYASAQQHLDHIRSIGNVAVDETLFNEFQDELTKLERCLIRGWTEIDESLSRISTAMFMLKRWRNK